MLLLLLVVVFVLMLNFLCVFVGNIIKMVVLVIFVIDRIENGRDSKSQVGFLFSE